MTNPLKEVWLRLLPHFFQILECLGALFLVIGTELIDPFLQFTIILDAEKWKEEENELHPFNSISRKGVVKAGDSV